MHRRGRNNNIYIYSFNFKLKSLKTGCILSFIPPRIAKVLPIIPNIINNNKIKYNKLNIR